NSISGHLIFPTQTERVNSLGVSLHAEVPTSGLMCHPSMRHPLFSSTLYPSPPSANSPSNILACLNAFEPKRTGSNPLEPNLPLHRLSISCLSTRSSPSHATTLHICLPRYTSAITNASSLGATTDPSSESNKLEKTGLLWFASCSTTIRQAVTYESAELESNPNRLSEFRELQTDLTQRVGFSVVEPRRSDSGESERRWTSRTDREGLHQRRPLQPLLEAEIDYVDRFRGGGGFEDGVVRGEVREFQGFLRVETVDSSSKCLSEERRDLPHGTSLRRREGSGVLHESLREARVPQLNRLRARHEGVDEMHAGFLHQNHRKRVFR
ncbi:hypothetical protein CR513_56973, partial [Mucuna pruriens]